MMLSLVVFIAWRFQGDFFKELVGVGQTYTITFPTPEDLDGRTVTVMLSPWHATRDVYGSVHGVCDNDGHRITCKAFMDLDDDVFASVLFRLSGDRRPNSYYGPFHVSIREKSHTYEADIPEKRPLEDRFIAPYHRGHGTPPKQEQTALEEPTAVRRTFTITFPTPKNLNGRTVNLSLSSWHGTRDIARGAAEGSCGINGPQVSCKATLNLPPDASAEVTIRFSGDQHPRFYFGPFHATVLDGSKTYEVDMPEKESVFEDHRIPPPPQ